MFGLESLSILNLLITLGMLIGGLAAYRYGFARTTNEVQERVIHTLESELQALRERISMLEQENARLHQTITALCSTLKRHGINVTIDGDEVRVHDHADSNAHSPHSGTRIFGSEAHISRSRHADAEVEQPASLPGTKPRQRKRRISHTSTRLAAEEEL